MATAIEFFLAMHAERSPRYCEKTPGMYIVSALSTDPERSFDYPAKGGTGIPQLLRAPIEVSDDQSTIRCLLNFVQVIRGLFYRDEIAVTQRAFQFSDTCFEHSLEFVPVTVAL